MGPALSKSGGACFTHLVGRADPDFDNAKYLQFIHSLRLLAKIYPMQAFQWAMYHGWAK